MKTSHAEENGLTVATESSSMIEEREELVRSIINQPKKRMKTLEEKKTSFSAS